MRKLLVALIIGALSLSTVNASHIAGGDLSYTCIGGNDYLITLSFYRDCSGIDAVTSAVLDFSSSCTGAFTVTLPRIAPTNGVEITPVCPGQSTTCSGGTLYGLQRYVYQAQVTLAPCADWVISYVEGNRNPSNTIQSPSSAYMYIQATLNSQIAPGNSSPTFSNPPSTIICNGQLFCYNHGAIDPDNDSLVYQLVTPFDQGPGSGSVYVTYLAGYSATQPLPSSPPVSMDPATGDICMTPTANITTVVAVLVTEYRNINGVPTVIGTVIRDMQLTVITCTNSLPTVGGINPNATSYNANDTTYVLPVCLGDTVAFNVYAYDPDTPADNLTLTWNHGIADASWNVSNNGSTNPVGHFFWVPTSAYVSNVPYCFTVNVRDDNCPYVGQQTLSYCLTIQGLEVSMNLPTDTLLCNGENLTIFASGDTNCVNWHWDVDGAPVTPINDSTYLFNSNTQGVGDHIVHLTVDNGVLTQCPGVDYVNIHVIQTPDVNLGPDDTICSGQSVTLDAGAGTLYFWSPGAQLTQTIDAYQSGQYSVTVDGGNNTRCKDSDTINIKVLTIPSVNLGTDLCVTDPVLLDAGNPGFQYNWTNGSGVTVATTQTYMAGSSGDYTVTVGEILGHGCDASDQIHVKVLPVPEITLGPDTTICQHQAITLQVTGIGINLNQYDYVYSWYPVISSSPYITQAWLPEGTIPYIVTVTGCTDVSDTLNLTVHICNLTIPNIITPNGDPYNQYFFIPNLEYYPDSKLIVYNRWGRKVYESSNYQNDWDGGDSSDGVYYFVLQVNFGDTGNGEKIEEHHGTLTILR
jgi:gliding motility-associated-like protein